MSRWVPPPLIFFLPSQTIFPFFSAPSCVKRWRSLLVSGDSTSVARSFGVPLFLFSPRGANRTALFDKRPTKLFYCPPAIFFLPLVLSLLFFQWTPDTRKGPSPYWAGWASSWFPLRALAHTHFFEVNSPANIPFFFCTLPHLPTPWGMLLFFWVLFGLKSDVF